MNNIYSYIRLFSYLLVAVIAGFKLFKKMYTPYTLLGDLGMACVLVFSVACYSLFGFDYQMIVNYINTPAALIWAVVNYVDFLRCCNRRRK